MARNPCFLKVCIYVPFTAGVCLNGHEWAEHPLTKAGVACSELDNGFASCADAAKLQEVCDHFGPGHIHYQSPRCGYPL